MLKKIKPFIKPFIIFILIIIIILIILWIPSIINNNYQKRMITKIYNKTKQKINYLNIYNNYYIITTNKEIIVYDLNYKEIFKESLDKTSKLDYDIIYKKNKLLYEKTRVSKNKVIYTYYDIYTKDKIDSLEIEDKHDK